MAVVDAPPHYEANEVERVKVSIRAQTFLDVLQGAFQSTWGRPEALSQAMWEVSGTEEAKAGLRCLLSYVEALSPCLSRLCGVGGREGEAGAGRQGKGRRKRRKRGGGSRGSSGVDDVSEVGRNSFLASTTARSASCSTKGGKEARLDVACSLSDTLLTVMLLSAGKCRGGGGGA
jgi:hypothetical protein